MDNKLPFLSEQDEKYIEISRRKNETPSSFLKSDFEELKKRLPKNRIGWIEEASKLYGWHASMDAVPANCGEYHDEFFGGAECLMPTYNKDVTSVFGEPFYTENELKAKYLEFARHKAIVDGKWISRLERQKEEFKAVSQKYPVGSFVAMNDGEVGKVRSYDDIGNAHVLFCDGEYEISILDFDRKATDKEVAGWKTVYCLRYGDGE